jgi:hypothetical protein
MTDLMQRAQGAVSIKTIIPILIGSYSAGNNNDDYEALLSHINTVEAEAGVLMARHP